MKIDLICGNCTEKMEDIDENYIDLTVTSPPYDNLRSYNGYVFDYKRVAEQLFRITKQGGVVVWIVTDATINGSETLTSFKQAIYFKKIGFNVHDTMIWKKQTFTDTGSLQIRYGGIFEYMFIFSKGKPKTFNPIKDRLNKCSKEKKHGTVRQKDGKVKTISSIGKQISEYGQRFNVWEINTEVSNTKRCHPAQFPEQLVNDHVLSWSNKGDTILDPMMGSGTTGVVCKNLNRNFIGIEISEEYFEIAKKRINQTLRLFE